MYFAVICYKTGFLIRILVLHPLKIQLYSMKPFVSTNSKLFFKIGYTPVTLTKDTFHCFLKFQRICEITVYSSSKVWLLADPTSPLINISTQNCFYRKYCIDEIFSAVAHKIYRYSSTQFKNFYPKWAPFRVYWYKVFKILMRF